MRSKKGQLRSLMADGLQIINGGQTSKTIQSTLGSPGTQLPLMAPKLDAAFVLVRLYQVPPDAKRFVQTITYATNSQNPVALRDLRSNDDLQRQIELSMQDLGYEYRRQRGEGSPTKARPSELRCCTAAH